MAWVKADPYSHQEREKDGVASWRPVRSLAVVDVQVHLFPSIH